ncbi:PAS domain S-box protein [Flavobacterium soyangense]|uniref:histidine kinase n=1 Tax=Flavobacterium soyangense TaxID=2023265 RepID=A0A930XUT6_9FLAO|nr:PAS domain S-box protein [Flavobacterium soyangense]MBF2707566.1 PAS domain S-box protein [Flavobacterium soyangense]
MNNKYHKLLQKQIKKHLTIECFENPSFKAFFESVNDSYLAFERDKEIMDNSFIESEKEYHEVNNQLKKEIEFKQIAANNLYKSINKDDLDYDIRYDHNDDLLFVSEYLRAQIEKRKETETALLENMKELEDYKSALDQSALVALTDEKGIIKAVNDKFCETSEFNREELVGNTHQLVNSKFHSKAFFKDLWKTISTGNIWRGLIKNKKKNGDFYWVDTTIVPFLDANKKPFQYLAVRFDVTEIKNAEAEIVKGKELAEQSEERNRLIMNSSLNSIITIDSNKKIIFWNPQAETIFGWKEEEVLGKNLIDLIIPIRNKEKWDSVIENYLINGQETYFNQQVEFILLNKSGNEFFSEASVIPISQDGETFFCGFLQDISKRKKAEKSLLQTVELLKTLLANLQSGVLVEDENRKIMFTNQFFCDVFSIPLSPEKMIGIDNNDSAELSNESFKDAESFSPRIETILREKKLVTDELLETFDNKFLSRDYVPIFINDEYKGHLWKYTDVTQRIQNYKLLEQSEERTQIIMNSALNAIVTVDDRGKVTFWNDQAESVFGWKKEEVLGKVFTDFMVPVRNKDLWDQSIYEYLVEGHSDFLNRQVELFGVNKAGEEFIAEITITPITKNGETFFCAFLQDISKRKEAEIQIYETAELFKTLLANLNSGVLVEDENQNILFSNQLFWELKNKSFSAESMEGVDFSKSFEEDKYLFKDSESFVPRINELMNLKQPVISELMETVDNRFLERDYIPIFLNNEYKGHLWKYSDITQRMQNQKLLEQSEQRNSLIMNSSLNAIVNVDNEGKITFWNRQATNVFGWKSEDIMGKLLIETILPYQNKNIYDAENRNRIRKDDDATLKKHIELIGIKQDGEELTMDCSIIPINQNGGNFFCLFIQDITEKKEAENIRKIQEEKYKNVIAHMNLGLLEVDNNEIIQYVNQSFANISGYEMIELMGKNSSDFFVFGDDFDAVKTKNKLKKQGALGICQLPIKNKKGELRWWAISGAPNFDSKGNVIGSIGIHLDITEQKQLELDLEKEKTKALESSKAKETFLANMSHEIRTPLNAIIGFLRELDKQEFTELQKKYVDNSSIASKHLLAIINNILDISKIEAGEMSLESEDFIFEKSISNVVTVLQPLLEQKGLDYNISISNKIEKVLKGDALRLQQILFNLVGNSIKFTSKGSISINCEVVDDSAHSQEIQISISDTGIGMEDSYMATIFNKFSQEDKAVTRKYGGTGLGLSITYELVKLMDGRIEIESKKNVGTTFHIYIKYPKGSNQFMDDMDIDDPVSSIDNISILLVEDNYLNRMVAQNSLQYYNCKVTEAENGVEAIEILKNNKFDVILMDIQMPEMGGIEATGIIRNQLNLSTPIIALTANAFKTEIDKCRKAGMDDYVTKPFEEDILIETIAKHTTNKKTSIPKTVLPQGSSTSDQLYNLTSLLNLSRGNNEFVGKMIGVFVEQTTEVIEKISAAIPVDDFMEVNRLIHKIKPSVESLGITSIIKDIKLLEKIAKETKDKEQITTLFSVIKEVLEKAVIQLRENELNL